MTIVSPSKATPLALPEKGEGLDLGQHQGLGIEEGGGHDLDLGLMGDLDREDLGLEVGLGLGVGLEIIGETGEIGLDLGTGEAGGTGRGLGVMIGGEGD